MFQYLKDGNKKDRDSLFKRRRIERTWGSVYKSYQGRFQLNVRYFFFTLRKINHCNNLSNLSKDVVGLSRSEEEHKGVSGTLGN